MIPTTRPRFLRAVLLAAAVAVSAAAPATAQTVTGTLQGTVTDASGGVLPGVAMTIRNEQTGAIREVMTNEVGFYVAPFLAIGRYSVTVKLDGFQTTVHEAIRVSLNDTRWRQLRAEAGRRRGGRDRHGQAPPINSTSAEVKGVMSSEQIMDKPALSPGSFLDLATLFPGLPGEPDLRPEQPDGLLGSSINFNGTGTRGATFQINGVNNDDSSENQNRQGASLATIKEFQVISNTYSAEFGRGYGAVVLVQTKSGTNRWHGDGYWYLQDSNDLTALRKWATVKPDNQRNQYGGTAGFPIRTDRLFAFASFDRTRYQGTQNYARDLFLPSELALPCLTRGNDTPENRAWIQSVLDRYPKDATPNDSRSPRTYATNVGLQLARRGLLRPPRLAARTGQHCRPVSVHGADPRDRRRDPRRAGEAGQPAAEPRDHLDQGLPQHHGWGVPVRPGAAQDSVDIAAGKETPIVRFTARPCRERSSATRRPTRSTATRPTTSSSTTCRGCSARSHR